MKSKDCSVIIVPGLTGGTPDHWYSRWESKLPDATRVLQNDWLRPVLQDWTDRLVEAVIKAPRPVVLVAHSLGVITVAHAAPRVAERVVGAFLVAPPSPAVMKTIEAIDPAFAEIPEEPLPFPAVLIASSNDSYADFNDSQAMAKTWHIEFANAGEAGHINNESGHGPWPEGLMSFAGFLKTL